MRDVYPLLAIRFILGLVLFLHGAQKTFGWFNGNGLDNWANYISSVKMPLFNTNYPRWLAILAAYLEMFGGLAIIFGFGTKIAASLMVIFLLFAIYIAHWDKGFFITEGGYEYALVLLVLCSVLIVSGGGSYELFKLNL